MGWIRAYREHPHERGSDSDPKLHVSSVPFRKVDGQWVGGIVTPWSILVIRACGDPATWKAIPETKIGSVELPGGDFSFMGVLDPDLGGYFSELSLFQATGEAVARISLDTMLNPAERGYSLLKSRKCSRITLPQRASLPLPWAAPSRAVSA
ncbi:MAG: [NiFe]-hydrogenase assembly chaperone HybE [Dakarella massiliensis]